MRDTEGGEFLCTDLDKLRTFSKAGPSLNWARTGAVCCFCYQNNFINDSLILRPGSFRIFPVGQLNWPSSDGHLIGPISL